MPWPSVGTARGPAAAGCDSAPLGAVRGARAVGSLLRERPGLAWPGLPCLGHRRSRTGAGKEAQEYLPKPFKTSGEYEAAHGSRPR